MVSFLGAAKAPNIVFILTDDLDSVVTGPFYKDVLPQTMALKSEGIWYSNAFVTTPLCCPSRAAIFSGKYGHNNHVLGNGGPHGGREPFIPEEPHAIAAQLYRVGYRTSFIGKYFNGFTMKGRDPPSLPYGWTDGDAFVSSKLEPYRGYNYKMLHWKGGGPGTVTPKTQWVASNQKVERYGDEEQDYSTDVIKRKLLKFLETTKKEKDEQPFFAFVSPTCPHFPLPPAKRHKKQAARFGYESFPAQRPNYHADLGEHGTGPARGVPEDKPLFLQHSWKKRMEMDTSWGRFLTWLGADAPPDAPSTWMWSWHRVDWYNRMGSLLACDELVGETVQWLKENDEWDNTLFVFYSDNGYNLGSHGFAQKLVPYEESVRVPLLIAGGKNLKLRKGVTEDAWVLNIDFAPTFMDLVGLTPPSAMDGKSFKDSLFYSKGKHRFAGHDRFLVEYEGPTIADGYWRNFYTWHFEAAPPFFLDVPTFQAMRYKQKGKDYLFVRWDRYPVDRVFHRRYRNRRRLLMSRLESGNAWAKERLDSVLAKDYELYDIGHDPSQLDNLMYYHPEQYAPLRKHLEKELDRLWKCSGGYGSAQSCEAGDAGILPPA